MVPGSPCFLIFDHLRWLAMALYLPPHGCKCALAWLPFFSLSKVLFQTCNCNWGTLIGAIFAKSTTRAHPVAEETFNVKEQMSDSCIRRRRKLTGHLFFAHLLLWSLETYQMSCLVSFFVSLFTWLFTRLRHSSCHLFFLPPSPLTLTRSLQSLKSLDHRTLARS